MSLVRRDPHLSSTVHEQPTPNEHAARMLFQLALLVLFLLPAPIVNAADATHVELLYSANDAICKPLASLYDQLNHQALGDQDWEDHFKTRFDRIGFEQPAPLNDPIHRVINPDDLPRRGRFYRVDLFGDGEERLIYLQNVPVGDSDTFQTGVDIFAPGADIDAAPETLYHPFPSTKIALDIFGDAGAHTVGLPYYFDRISTPRQRSLPLQERIFTEPNLAGDLSQNIFRVRGAYVFTAKGPDLGTALAYAVNASATGIVDLCYFANTRYLLHLHGQE